MGIILCGEIYWGRLVFEKRSVELGNKLKGDGDALLVQDPRNV